MERKTEGDVQDDEFLRRMRIQVSQQGRRGQSRANPYGREAVPMPTLPQKVQDEAPLQLPHHCPSPGPGPPLPALKQDLVTKK